MSEWYQWHFERNSFRNLRFHRHPKIYWQWNIIKLSNHSLFISIALLTIFRNTCVSQPKWRREVITYGDMARESLKLNILYVSNSRHSQIVLLAALSPYQWISTRYVYIARNIRTRNLTKRYFAPIWRRPKGVYDARGRNVDSTSPNKWIGINVC